MPLYVSRCTLTHYICNINVIAVDAVAMKASNGSEYFRFSLRVYMLFFVSTVGMWWREWEKKNINKIDTQQNMACVCCTSSSFIFADFIENWIELEFEDCGNRENKICWCCLDCEWTGWDLDDAEGLDAWCDFVNFLYF